MTSSLEGWRSIQLSYGTLDQISDMAVSIGRLFKLST